MTVDSHAAMLGLAADVQGTGRLRQLARNDPQQAVRETARQFEALLLNTLMKSMREATAQDGPFDNEHTRLYTSLLDQQFAQSLAKRGIGLAEVLSRQLLPASGGAVQANAAAAAPPLVGALPPGTADARQPSEQIEEFVARLQPGAQQTAAATGIPARFLIGHAALESGWGRHEIRRPDGSTSFNLFALKAGPDWSGEVVEAKTTEYVNGAPVRSVEKFRGYASYEEAFRDYAHLLRSNPRYAGVFDHAGDARAFARELQEGGYATDPLYAYKLARVIDGSSLRLLAAA